MMNVHAFNNPDMMRMLRELGDASVDQFLNLIPSDSGPMQAPTFSLKQIIQGLESDTDRTDISLFSIENPERPKLDLEKIVALREQKRQLGIDPTLSLSTAQSMTMAIRQIPKNAPHEQIILNQLVAGIMGSHIEDLYCLEIIASYLTGDMLDIALSLPLPAPRGGRFTRFIDDARLGPMHARAVCATCQGPRGQCPIHLCHAVTGLTTNPFTYPFLLQLFPCRCPHCPRLLTDSGATSVVPDAQCRIFNYVPLPFSEQDILLILNSFGSTTSLHIQVGAEFLTEEPRMENLTNTDLLNASIRLGLPPEIPSPASCPSRIWASPSPFMHTICAEERRDNNNKSKTAEKWRQEFMKSYRVWAADMDSVAEDWNKFWKQLPCYIQLLGALTQHAHTILEAIHNKQAPARNTSMGRVQSKITSGQQKLRNKQIYLHLLRLRCWQTQQVLCELKKTNLLTFGGLQHARNEELLRKKSLQVYVNYARNELRAIETEGRSMTNDYFRTIKKLEELQSRIYVCDHALDVADLMLTKARLFFAEAVFARERATGRLVVRHELRKWMDSIHNPFQRPDGTTVQSEPFEIFTVAPAKKTRVKKETSKKKTSEKGKKKRKPKTNDSDEDVSKKKKKPKTNDSDEDVSKKTSGKNKKQETNHSNVNKKTSGKKQETDDSNVSKKTSGKKQETDDSNVSKKTSGKKQETDDSNVSKKTSGKKQETNDSNVSKKSNSKKQETNDSDVNKKTSGKKQETNDSDVSKKPNSKKKRKQETKDSDENVTKNDKKQNDEMQNKETKKKNNENVEHGGTKEKEKNKESKDGQEKQNEKEDSEEKQRREKERKQGENEPHILLLPPTIAEMESWSLFSYHWKETRRLGHVTSSEGPLAFSTFMGGQETKFDVIKSMQTVIKKAWTQTHLPNMTADCPQGSYPYCALVFGGCGFHQVSMTCVDAELKATMPGWCSNHAAMPAVGQFFHNDLWEAREVTRIPPGWSDESRAKGKTRAHSLQLRQDMEIKYTAFRNAMEIKKDLEWTWERRKFLGFTCRFKKYKDKSVHDQLDFGEFDLTNEDDWERKKYEWPIEPIHLWSMMANMDPKDIERIGMKPDRSHPEWMLWQSTLIPSPTKFQMSMLVSSDGSDCNAVVDPVIHLYLELVNESAEMQDILQVLEYNLASPLIIGELCQNRWLSSYGIKYQRAQRQVQNLLNRIIHIQPQLPLPSLRTYGTKSRTTRPDISAEGYVEFQEPAPKKPSTRKRKTSSVDAATTDIKEDEYGDEKSKASQQEKWDAKENEDEKKKKENEDEKKKEETLTRPVVERLNKDDDDVMMAIRATRAVIKDTGHLRPKTLIQMQGGREGRMRLASVKSVGYSGRAVQRECMTTSVLKVTASQNLCRESAQPIPVILGSMDVVTKFVDERVKAQGCLVKQHKRLVKRHLQKRARRSLYDLCENPDLTYGTVFPSVLSIHRVNGKHQQSIPFHDIDWAKHLEPGDLLHINQGILLHRSPDPDARSWSYQVEEPNVTALVVRDLPDKNQTSEVFQHTSLASTPLLICEDQSDSTPEPTSLSCTSSQIDKSILNTRNHQSKQDKTKHDAPNEANEQTNHMAHDETKHDAHEEISNEKSSLQWDLAPKIPAMAKIVGGIRPINVPTGIQKRPPVFKTMLALGVQVGGPGGALGCHPCTQAVVGGDFDGDAVALSCPQTLAAIHSARQYFSPMNLFLRTQCGSDIGLLQDMITMWTMISMSRAPWPWRWFISCLAGLESLRHLSSKQLIAHALASRRWSDKRFPAQKTPFYKRGLLSDKGENYDTCGWDGRDLLLHILPRGMCYRRREQKPFTCPIPASVTPASASTLSSPVLPCPTSLVSHSSMLPDSTLPTSSTASNEKPEHTPCECGNPEPGCEVHIEKGWLLHGVLNKDDLGTGFGVLSGQIAMFTSARRAAMYIDDMSRVCLIFNVLAGWSMSFDDRWLDISTYRQFRRAINTCRIEEQAKIAQMHDEAEEEHRRFWQVVDDRETFLDSNMWLLESYHQLQKKLQQQSDLQILVLAQKRSDIIGEMMKKHIKEGAKNLPRYKNKVVITSRNPVYQKRIDELVAQLSMAHHFAPRNIIITIETDQDMQALELEVLSWMTRTAEQEARLDPDERAKRVWSSLFEGWYLFLMTFAKAKGKASECLETMIGLDMQLLNGQLMPLTQDGRMCSYDAHGDGVDARGAVHNYCYNKGLGLNASIKSHLSAVDKLVKGQNQVFEMGTKHRNMSNCLFDLVVHHDGTIRDSSGTIVSLSHGYHGANGLYDNVLSVLEFHSLLDQCLKATSIVTSDKPWYLYQANVEQVLEKCVTSKWLPVFKGDEKKVKTLSLLDPQYHENFPAFFPKPVDLKQNDTDDDTPNQDLKQNVNQTTTTCQATFTVCQTTSTIDSNHMDCADNEKIALVKIEPLECIEKESLEYRENRKKPLECEKDKEQVLHKWKEILTADAYTRLVQNGLEESTRVVEEAQRLIYESQFLLHHLNNISKCSQDPLVRVPFLVSVEVERMRANKINLSRDQKSDLLPSEVIDHVHEFLRRCHGHGHTLFVAMHKHGYFYGQRVIQWHVLSELSSQRAIEHYHLTKMELIELLERMFVRFECSRITAGELPGVVASMGVCEPFEQSTLNLKHTLNLLVSGTEGTPRFMALVSLTQSPNDYIVHCQLRRQNETPQHTGIRLIWDGKDGLTEEEKIRAHFTQINPHLIFPSVMSIDYDVDTKERLRDTSADWKWMPVDGDAPKWKQFSSRYAFCIVINVMQVVLHGAEVAYIVQRIRLMLDYSYVVTALGSAKKAIIRVYGRLVAPNEEIRQRLKWSEQMKRVGFETLPTKCVQQYSTQKEYLEHVGQIVVSKCLPQTHVTRVSWNPDTRKISMLLDKTAHSLPFLHMLGSRPEFITQTFKYGDIKMRPQYAGIQSTRRELVNDFIALVNKIQYVTPSLSQVISDYMTADGILVPLDYRSLQQRASSDPLCKGSLNRSPAAICDGSIRGSESDLGRIQTATMAGCPSPNGPYFQTTTLTISSDASQLSNEQHKYLPQPLSRPSLLTPSTAHLALPAPLFSSSLSATSIKSDLLSVPNSADLLSVPNGAPLVSGNPFVFSETGYEDYLNKRGHKQWDPRYEQEFGTDELHRFMNDVTLQYESNYGDEEGESEEQKDTVTNLIWQDPHIVVLSKMLLSDHTSLLSHVEDAMFLFQWNERRPMFVKLLDVSPIADESLTILAADQTRAFWNEHKQLSSQKDLETEARMGFGSPGQLNISHETFQKLVLCFQDLVPLFKTFVRVDTSIKKDRAPGLWDERVRIEQFIDEEERVRYTRKKNMIRPIDTRESDFSLRVAVMKETTLETLSNMDMDFEVIRQAAPERQHRRDKHVVEFELDNMVLLTLERVEEDGQESFHLEIEQIHRSVDVPHLYLFYKYVFLISNLASIAMKSFT